MGHDTIDDGNFRLLAQNSVDMICFVGLDLMMSYASPACTEILGWSPEEMCGKGPDTFVFEEDLPIVAAARQKLMIHGVDHEPTTVRMKKKDGTLAWMEIYARVVKGESPEDAKGIVLTMRDITVRKRREEDLESLSQIDDLTRLANRRMFDLGLDREWRRAVRERRDLSLLLLDVDYFKDLNDYYGHLYGDRCLRSIASEIGRIVTRATDVIARYGGEEFAIILPATGQSGSLRLAEAIRSGIESLRIEHHGRPMGDPWVTVSIGISTAHGVLEQDAKGIAAMEKMPERLLKSADDALYLAKERGRNRVERGQ